MTQREKRLGLIAAVVFGGMFAWMGRSEEHTS
jgi:hypothetical protein